MRWARRLLDSAALALYRGGETIPGPEAQTDDALLAYARARGSTVYHAMRQVPHGRRLHRRGRAGPARARARRPTRGRRVRDARHGLHQPERGHADDRGESIRNLDALRAGSLPVYAAGVTHRGPYKDGPGEINVALGFDGMVVEPGDLMIGDSGGILCIPFGQVDAVLEAAPMDRHAASGSR